MPVNLTTDQSVSKPVECARQSAARGEPSSVSFLREHLPDLKIRVINLVDQMKLQSASEHPHGFSESDYDSLFTKDSTSSLAFTDARGWSTA